MKTTDIFAKKPVLSFEVFPPKRTNPVETIYETLDSLRKLNPDFISVTYGAGMACLWLLLQNGGAPLHGERPGGYLSP